MSKDIKCSDNFWFNIFFNNLFEKFLSKKWYVLIFFFLLATLTTLLAGSTPIIFLYPLSLNSFNNDPSLLPISKMKLLIFKSNLLIVFVEKALKCSIIAFV